MITIKLTRNKVFQWYNADGIWAKGYFFAPDGKLYRDADLCSYFGSITDEADFRQKLLTANGLFSVLIQKDKLLWMAVDRVRRFPLFYRIQNGNLYLGDEVDNLFAPGEQKEIDEEACLTFSGCSYVLGNKTLLKNIFQVQAGEWIKYDGIRISPSFYHLYFAEKQNDISFDEAKIQLKKIFQNVGRRMAQLIGNRPVILSLSGGLDSRMIAYLLKKTGKKNVLCYTFGIKEGNPEWKRSKAVAERLGFDWLFVDYSTIDDLQFYKKKPFIDYYPYVAQCVSKFGVVQYFPANYLINELGISTESIFFTGAGGDFFAGSHLRPYMQKYKSITTIAQDLQYIHCDLVRLQKTERKKIRNFIRQELENTRPLFANVENWDLKERQAKYILNGAKLWEYYGIKSLIPLCDNELMDFFVSLPFEYRLNQKLHRTVLAELFEEFDINFPQDIKTQEKIMFQQFKVFIKRAFPFLRKKPDLFRHDYFNLKRIYQSVLKEMQKEDQIREIISSNGIFSEWYLMQVKKEIKKLKK
jgi:asparagine synthase (glutamine-hydrolysing)